MEDQLHDEPHVTLQQTTSVQMLQATQMADSTMHNLPAPVVCSNVTASQLSEQIQQKCVLNSTVAKMSGELPQFVSQQGKKVDFTNIILS